MKKRVQLFMRTLKKMNSKEYETSSPKLVGFRYYSKHKNEIDE